MGCLPTVAPTCPPARPPPTGLQKPPDRPLAHPPAALCQPVSCFTNPRRLEGMGVELHLSPGLIRGPPPLIPNPPPASQTLARLTEDWPASFRQLRRALVNAQVRHLPPLLLLCLYTSTLCGVCGCLLAVAGLATRCGSS